MSCFPNAKFTNNLEKKKRDESLLFSEKQYCFCFQILKYPWGRLLQRTVSNVL